MADSDPKPLKWLLKPSAIFAEHSVLLEQNAQAEENSNDNVWLNHWHALGPAACQRLTRVWAEGDEAPFFVTVSPCVSLKLRVWVWYKNGMVLDRCTHGSDEVMVVKPHPEERVQVLQVDVEKKGPFYVHCTIYKMSGAEVMNEELPADATWWHLSRECYKQGMANVSFQKMGKLVGRQFWDRRIHEFFDESSVHPGALPRHAKAPKAPRAKAAVKSKAKVPPAPKAASKSKAKVPPAPEKAASKRKGKVPPAESQSKASKKPAASKAAVCKKPAASKR